MALTNKKLLLPLKWRLKHYFLFDHKKLIESSSTSAVSGVLSNPYNCRLPRTKISLFLLLGCTDEHVATPKIMAFLPQSKIGIEKSKRE